MLGQESLFARLLRTAKTGDAAQLKVLCDALKQKNKEHLLLQQDNDGWTALHFAARFNNFYAVNCLIKELGDKARIASQKLTNAGETPAKLVTQNPNEQERNKILNSLEMLMQQHTMVALSTPPDEKNILDRFSKECCDPQFKRMLEHGIELLREGRKEITYSESHLFENQVDAKVKAEKMKSVRQKIRDGIGVIDQAAAKKLGENNADVLNAEEIKRIIAIDCERNEKLFAMVHEVSVAEVAGNCAEMACSAVHRSHMIQSQWPKEYRFTVDAIYYCKTDHALNVLKRDPLSPLSQPWQWGNFLAVDVFNNTIHYGFEDFAQHAVTLDSHFDPVSNERKFLMPIQYNRLFESFALYISNQTRLETLANLDDKKKKDFFFLLDGENRNCFHQYSSKPHLILKVLFQYLHELKDDKLAKEVLAIRDHKNQLPLHGLAQNRDPNAIRLCFSEYVHYFGSEVKTMLFGKNFSDMSCVSDACEHENPVALNAFFRHFADDDLVKKEIFDHIVKLFLQSDRSQRAHQFLWKYCCKIMDAETRYELLARHNKYKEFIERHAKLKAKKKAEFMPQNAVGLFSQQAQTSKRDLFKSLPDLIEMNENMELNFTFDELQNFECELLKLELADEKSIPAAKTTVEMPAKDKEKNDMNVIEFDQAIAGIESRLDAMNEMLQSLVPKLGV